MTISNITGNSFDPDDLIIKVGDVTYLSETTRDSSGSYETIFGGDLDPSQNYSVNIGVLDSVMKELNIEPVVFTETVSGKLPLSLLDNL